MVAPETAGSQTPTLLYHFTHRYLPGIVFNHTDLFLAKAHEGRKQMEAMLRQAFAGFQNDAKSNFLGKEITLGDDDFSTSLAQVGNNVSLLLIKFPQPTETTEVFYVGVTLVDEPRFFTLELHKPLLVLDETHPPVDTYNFCEWERDGTHVLKHDLSEPRPGYFAGAIDTVLNSTQSVSAES